MNYKRIPYTTRWVEYPDVEGVLKEIGGKPTSKRADGRDLYTLPAIYDAETKKVITESMDIAVYLDETFPDSPRLIPEGARAAVKLVDLTYMEKVVGPLLPLMLPAVCYKLNPASFEYFRTTREASFKKKLEEFAPVGPVRDEGWAAVKRGLSVFASLYARNGEGKEFFFANTFSYADAIVLGWIIWVKIVLGAENEEWKAVASWNGGKWARLLEITKEYQAIL